MRKSIIAAGATTAAVVVAMTGLAGPAAAADKWTMPNVKGEVLQTALNDIRAVTGDVELNINLIPDVNQEVLNMTNWKVCAFSPRAGNEISQKTKRVNLALKRLNDKC